MVVGYDFFRLCAAAGEKQRCKDTGPVFADFAEEEQRLTGFSSLCDHLAFRTCIQNLHSKICIDHMHSGLVFDTGFAQRNVSLCICDTVCHCLLCMWQVVGCCNAHAKLRHGPTSTTSRLLHQHMQHLGQNKDKCTETNQPPTRRPMTEYVCCITKRAL